MNTTTPTTVQRSRDHASEQSWGVLVVNLTAKRYVQISMGMAEDERRWANVSRGETEVVPDGEPLLLLPEEAAKWKPRGEHWAEHLRPAPGQGPGQG